jgi:SAM-dependent methyltransferase
MAITFKNLQRIRDLLESGLLPPGGSIVELGAQQIYCQGNETSVVEFIACCSALDPAVKPASVYSRKEIARFADIGYLGELLTACGFEYQSLDLINAYNTVLFDLNIHEVPEALRGRFDLVTNFGTTEHLINQALAMQTMHDLAKPGGIIYHDLPMSGYLTHGYFSYTPLFFQDLAAANDYKVVQQYFSRAATPVAAPKFMRENGFPDAEFANYGLDFILQKTSDAPFHMPLDPTTSLSIDQTVWGPVAAGSPNYSRSQAAALDRVSGWELQRQLFGRYRKRMARWFGR